MLRSLRLQNFRSYKDQTFTFQPGVNLITGANGSGKTTILEAIHLVCRGSSFRSSDDVVVHHEADWSRIEMAYGDDVYTLKLVRQPRSKTRLKNNQAQTISSLQSLLFEPEQLRILHGPPDLRRCWIDELIASHDPSYNKAVVGYRRALRQRNTLLISGRYHKDDLFVWDVKLAEYGAVIARERRDQIERFNARLTPTYRRISGSGHTIDIRYDTPFQTDYGSEFLRSLHERLETDARRGFTSCGPHREDILVTLDGRPVDEVASRGERRTIYLATKLLEHEQIVQSAPTTSSPLLLLDDIFAEFDQQHKNLIASIDVGAQVLITSTDEDAYPGATAPHHIHTN